MTFQHLRKKKYYTEENQCPTNILQSIAKALRIMYTPSFGERGKKNNGHYYRTTTSQLTSQLVNWCILIGFNYGHLWAAEKQTDKCKKKKNHQKHTVRCSGLIYLSQRVISAKHPDHKQHEKTEERAERAERAQ